MKKQNQCFIFTETAGPNTKLFFMDCNESDDRPCAFFEPGRVDTRECRWFNQGECKNKEANKDTATKFISMLKRKFKV